MTTITAFDHMSASEAARLLAACCGATRWVDGMLARRPFGDIRTLLAAADDVWSAMDPSDWREAFEHHPRLGESRSAEPQGERERSWSAGEQAGMRDAASSDRTALAAANAAYEQRFGYICIICATGLGASEILRLTRERLANDPEDELAIAAEEQRKITRLRLLKLFHEPDKAVAS